MATLSNIEPVDQATIAKWESGETGVRVQDLELLARVYGVSADRLLFAPTDNETPERLKRAYTILSQSDPKAIEAWLAMGEALSRK
ncbi:hypothetical protein AA103193_2360 [Tanticharoenia sakaeratensis NBRC 103193]|nr:hypothetical protein AA103193_2360 [Tanticharoenia sakaeratensis NBRC 103193]